MITLGKNTKNKVELINDSPYIKVDVKLDAKILSVSKNSNYIGKDDLSLVESYAESYIKNKLENYLYKTSKEYKSDIASFGRYAVRNFYTQDKWIEYNWLDNYSNSFFNINVDVNVISSYLVS